VEQFFDFGHAFHESRVEMFAGFLVQKGSFSLSLLYS